MPDSRPSVLVTDAGFTPGLTVVRSLGRGGWRVIATHGEDRPRWSTSRYAHRWYTVPSVEHEPRRFTDRIAALASEEEIDLILATTDKSIYPIDANRELFETRSTLALPNPEALRTARDKDRTTDLAASLGIPTPRSLRADDFDSARRAADEIGWPVVIKPISSHAPDADGRITTRSVFHAENVGELEQAAGSERLGGFPVQVQQRVGRAGGWGGAPDVAGREGGLLPTPAAPRSPIVWWHELLPDGREPRSDLARPQRADPCRTRLERPRHGRVQTGKGRAPFCSRSTAGCGGRSPCRCGQALTSRCYSPSDTYGPGVWPRPPTTSSPVCVAETSSWSCGGWPWRQKLASVVGVAMPRFHHSKSPVPSRRWPGPSTEFDAQILEDWRPGLFDAMRSITSLIDDLASRRRRAP